MKLYKCNKCNNLIEIINGENKLSCCGNEMEELIANTVDAATEKHKPFLERKDNKVKISIGETLHPMNDDHYIEFIYIKSGNLTTKLNLMPGDKPEYEIESSDKIIVYSYCNLHGLWKSEI